MTDNCVTQYNVVYAGCYDFVHDLISQLIVVLYCEPLLSSPTY